MKLHIEQSCSNRIDIVDGVGSTVASIINNSGDGVTDTQKEIAQLICKSFNRSPESNTLLYPG